MTGSFALVECYILMTLSTQSSHHTSSSFLHTWTTPLVKHISCLGRPGGESTDDRFTMAVTHESRWARAEEKESEWEVERHNLTGLVLSSLIKPLSLFPPFLVLFFSPLLEVVMTILNTVSMEKDWARAISPLHSLVWQCGKGHILTSYLAWWNNRLSFIYGFMRMVFRGWPLTGNA